jgi:predicted N-acyltransferase
MGDAPDIQVERVDGLGDVDPAAWDALTGADDPFLEHAFLWALEDTQCVGATGTGWTPRHLLARQGGTLVGAMPLYEKAHSYGEYIFDWSWANASQGAGVPYYPKLVSAVPFTPVTGRRLLLAPDAPGEAVGSALMAGLGEAAEALDCWSAHVLFCTASERQTLGAGGLLERVTHQYQWRNEDGWRAFSDYLAAMRSRPRKEIRRERRLAAESGLRFEWRTGEETEPADWDAMWHFYQDTTGRKHGSAYLTRAFFDRLGQELRHRVHLALAFEGSERVAGALFFEKGDRLIGRYWGTASDAPFVHFELCYYMPIERCLTQGMSRFEAGAQGDHKLKRGLLPRETHSASWFRAPGLGDAVGRYLVDERMGTAREIAWLLEHGPFRDVKPALG